jgi:hypothetical protein
MDAESEAFLETPAATVHRVSPAVTAEGRTVTASPLDTVAAFEFVAIHDDGPPTRVSEDDDVASIVAPSPPIIVAIPPHNIAIAPAVIAITPPVIIVVVIIIVVAIAPSVIIIVVATPLDAPIAPIIVVVASLDAPWTTIVVVIAIATLSGELGGDCQTDDCQEEPDQRPHRGCTSLNMLRVGRGHRASLRKATRGIVVSSAAVRLPPLDTVKSRSYIVRGADRVK